MQRKREQSGEIEVYWAFSVDMSAHAVLLLVQDASSVSEPHLPASKHGQPDEDAEAHGGPPPDKDFGLKTHTFFFDPEALMEHGQ